ncbi:hypothetical protein NFI96_014384 [Prochilodus magdalenae]|nr:hypothetical protein NFI96_014384 [Prochilodus magdalenae]
MKKGRRRAPNLSRLLPTPLQFHQTELEQTTKALDLLQAPHLLLAPPPA